MLRVAARNRVIFDANFYLRPLASILDKYSHICAVLIDRREAVWYDVANPDPDLEGGELSVFRQGFDQGAARFGRLVAERERQAQALAHPVGGLRTITVAAVVGHMISVLDEAAHHRSGRRRGEPLAFLPGHDSIVLAGDYE